MVWVVQLQKKLVQTTPFAAASQQKMNLGFLFNNYAYIGILLYTPHFLFLGSHFENCGDVKKEDVKKRGKTQLFRKLLKTNTNFEKKT